MMGRGVGFWIWFGHGIGLVCMGMCVVKAGASRKKEIGARSHELPLGRGVGVCAGVWRSLLLGEVRVLPLGMWPDCFAHTRSGAGAVLGGRGAAGRRAGAARPRPAPAPPRPAGRR
jgi:hypothetical protein